jgi:hypothetical protein
LQKRSKKLLQICSNGPIQTHTTYPTDKSLFASFSSEKEESFLPKNI